MQSIPLIMEKKFNKILLKNYRKEQGLLPIEMQEEIISLNLAMAGL